MARTSSKASRSLVAAPEPRLEYSDTPSGFVDGKPYYNNRLPWLADRPICHLHSPFRDPGTGYAYCKDCGWSFGLV